MKPLPLTRYQYETWKKAPAGIDDHVAIKKHYCSVLYRYLKTDIDVRITNSTIECFYQNNRIALHRRSPKLGHTTLCEHMPPSHQNYNIEWTLER